jgi:hypothetical protein
MNALISHKPPFLRAAWQVSHALLQQINGRDALWVDASKKSEIPAKFRMLWVTAWKTTIRRRAR